MSGANGSASPEADGASLDAHRLALSRQKTGPLVPLREQPRERAAALEATPLEGTNHHQPGEQHSELPAGREG